jgi:predicted permease
MDAAELGRFARDGNRLMSRWWDRLVSAAVGLRFRFRALVSHRARDRELAEELRHHLLLREEQEAARGLTAPAARRAARVRFGSVGRIHDDTRNASRFVALADFADDAVHGARLLRRSPAFAITAVLILSVGIGINVWIFSAMNALLFPSFAGVSDPSRLVALGRMQHGEGFDTLSYPDAMALRARNTVLEELAFYSDLSVTVEGSEQTARLRGQVVSANFFRVIGGAMTEGRGFADDDDRGGALAAVVSEDFRRRTLGSDRALSGATLRINRVPIRIVGVAPRGFQGFVAGAPVDVWLPMRALSAVNTLRGVPADPRENRAAHWLWLVGRLSPGTSISQARTSIGRLGAELAAETHDEDGRGIAVEPVGAVGPATRGTVLRVWALLNGISTLVLLVVCFNVANMTLARVLSRLQEMRLRASLGATRLRLVRQLLGEHVVLALAGGIGGGLVAWWVSGVFRAAVPPAAPIPSSGFAPDWRVLAFTAAIAVASSVMFTLPAAWMAGRQRASGAVPVPMGSGSRIAPPARLRSVFAVLQVALALALLIGATLLGRSLQNAMHVDLGFQAGGVVTAYYDLEAAGYGRVDGASVHAQVVDRLRQWGAVDVAALGAHSPLQGASLGLPITVKEDGPATPARQLVRTNVITPEFFRALRTPILIGREFSDKDGATAPRVAVINETCRRTCFGGANPIGRRFVMFTETEPREIVGVVADSKYSQPLEQVRPTVFVPAAQYYSPRMAILLRTSSPAAVLQALPGIVRGVNPAVPVYDAFTLEDRLSLALWPSRAMSALAGGFGLLTLILAVLGVYGVVSDAAEQRSQEIAVRMALGAEPRMILRMVLRRGVSILGAGTAIGVALSWLCSGALEAFLYGVEPVDPTTIVAAAAVLAAVTLVACLLPARRAAATSPGHVLRQ